LTAAFRVLCIMGGVAGIAAGLCLSLTRYSEVLRSPTADGLLIVSHLLGSILLGSVTVAWLLGHAYLTATKMTIAPLMHFSRVLSWAVAARAAFLVLSLGAAWLVGAEGGQAVSAVIYNSWLVTSLRILMGIVVLGVFAYMVAGCVRIRSTQSATGILYFGSVFAYIGELAGLQLIQECGWPL